MENINLPASLTSRFDLVYLMLDKQNPVNDQLLARHIVSMFSETDVKQKVAPIPQDLLKAYIAFAQTRCHPKMTDDAKEKLADTYMRLRNDGRSSGAVLATPRMLESILN